MKKIDMKNDSVYEVFQLKMMPMVMKGISKVLVILLRLGK